MNKKAAGLKTGLKIREALKAAEARLLESGVEGARNEAEHLLMHLLDCGRHELFLNAEKRLSLDEAEEFTEYVRRRAKREPSQYITGVAEFMGFSVKVTPATLIPRPETELVVEEVIRLSRGVERPAEGPVIIDLCTGSGCIAVALAKALPDARLYATDVSGAALEVAAFNAETNGVRDRVVLARGDLYAALKGFELDGSADFITANPPYVTDWDFKDLAPEIREHEPEKALRAGVDGLDVIRRIIAGAPEYLSPGGWLVMEIGYGQGKAVKKLTDGSGTFKEVALKKDLAGIERILVAGTNRLS